eukprot:11273248-Alexandrium_andersonii.AAC.1
MATATVADPGALLTFSALESGWGNKFMLDHEASEQMSSKIGGLRVAATSGRRDLIAQMGVGITEHEE